MSKKELKVGDILCYYNDGLGAVTLVLLKRQISQYYDDRRLSADQYWWLYFDPEYHDTLWMSEAALIEKFSDFESTMKTHD